MPMVGCDCAFDSHLRAGHWLARQRQANNRRFNHEPGPAKSFLAYDLATQATTYRKSVAAGPLLSKPSADHPVKLTSMLQVSHLCVYPVKALGTLASGRPLLKKENFATPGVLCWLPPTATVWTEIT